MKMHLSPLGRAAEGALVLGATMRLTRLVVADDLGQWWVKDPLHRLAHEHTPPTLERPRWAKYLDGLDCPFCVGFWVGVGVLASHSVMGRSRPWRFVAAALTLNEVAAHLGARLGDTAE